MSDIALHLGDCLDVMAGLPDGSVDAVVCDLPYGTTACAWDVVIPFEPLWNHYRRLLKPRGAVVLTASQPFTSMLVISNMAWFKYCLVWDKALGGNPLNAPYQPMKTHEDICVFSAAASTHSPGIRMIYNAQMRPGDAYKKSSPGGVAKRIFRSKIERRATESQGDQRYPVSIINISNARRDQLHPTQKPVALFEYLILTYSNPGDVILDSCMGSGTTLVACVNTGRSGVGIEKDPTYFEIAENRIADARMRLDRPHAPPLRLKATADACSLFDALEAS